MRVRRLTADDDLSGAIELLQRFFVEEGFVTPAHTIADRTRTMAGLKVCRLFVAEEEGSAIAVATASREFGIEFGWWAEMGDLYVLPEWRGRGVSQALVEAIESDLRQSGIAGYQVTVTPSGDEHHGLTGYYRRLGFGGDGRLLLFKYLSP